MGPLDGFDVGPLAGHHDRERFSCGQADLDKYLRENARKQDANDTTRLHVYANQAGEIGGFYTLSALMIELTGLPLAIQHGRPKMAVPATLLGKLAVDQQFQGKRVGEFLLSHAIRTAMEARKLVASALLVIDAKPTAIDWYRKQPVEWEAMPDDPLRLLLPLELH